MLESALGLDGVPLDNEKYGWLVEETTGLPASQARKVTLVELPFVDGARPVRGGRTSSVTAISVWVSNPDTGRSVERLHERVSILQALCEQAHTLSFSHGKYAKNTYESVVYSIECSTPEIVGLGVAGVKVKLQITHAPGWRLAGSEVRTRVGEGVNRLSAFAGSGVVQDATLEFKGTASEVEITSEADGTSLKLTGVTGSSKVDVGVRKVSGVTGWDYAPAGFLQVASKITADGVMPVLRLKVSNSRGFECWLKGAQWLR